MKRIDLTGKQFYRLTVTGYSHSHIQPSGQKRAIWDVVCSCGTKLKAPTSNLISNNTKSCGCYIDELRRKGMIKLNPESAIEEQYRHTKGTAKKRNKIFNLTYEQFKEISVKNCNYCGSEPYERYSQVKNSKKIKLNGIDRVNPKIGYTIGNCVPCCGTCNTMKMDRSLDEFLMKITEIYLKCQSTKAEAKNQSAKTSKPR
jgi:hypothetical protein